MSLLNLFKPCYTRAGSSSYPSFARNSKNKAQLSAGLGFEVRFVADFTRSLQAGCMAEDYYGAVYNPKSLNPELPYTEKCVCSDSVDRKHPKP